MNIATVSLIAGLFSYEMIVDEIVERGHYRISVPEFSELLNKDNIPFAGNVLAKRVKEILSEVLKTEVKIEYRVRKGEHWTREKEKENFSKWYQYLTNHYNTSLF